MLACGPSVKRLAALARAVRRKSGLGAEIQRVRCRFGGLRGAVGFAPTGATSRSVGRSRRVLDLSRPGDDHEHLFPQSAGGLGLLGRELARQKRRNLSAAAHALP